MALSRNTGKQTPMTAVGADHPPTAVSTTSVAAGRCPCCGMAIQASAGRFRGAFDDGLATSEGDPRAVERMLIRLGGNGF